MICPACQTSIPHNGKFCPKCGLASPQFAKRPAPARSDVHPSHAPIPRAGKVFFTLLIIGLTLTIAGFTLGGSWIAIAGSVIVALLLLLLLVGDAFF